ncbi:MAG: hypothetical protein OXF50_04610 [Caldilineaceae bacterium]|nr:hypothetical protein [Caldilineaceae bacterium]
MVKNIFRRDKPGFVEGKHYTGYVEQVNRLKREGQHDKAVRLLLKLVDATEAESKNSDSLSGVAPWYYEQLAIVYRKEKRYGDEVAILERYEKQPKAPGASPGKLAKRLKQARTLQSSN